MAARPLRSCGCRAVSRGTPCQAGTSPKSGSSSRTRCPTRPHRSTATNAWRGPTSTGAPTAWPARCSTTGRRQQDKVAQYLYNCPEYLESVFAAFKAGLVPVNTNYRYADDELVYLWDNADAVAVVFHGTFVERIERIRDRSSPRSRRGSGSTTAAAPAPSGPSPTRTAAAPTEPGRAHRGGRGRATTILLMYTGGTTGMPKGVMWRQDDLVTAVVVERLPPVAPASARLRRHPRQRRRPRPGQSLHARPAAHARHRPVHAAHHRSASAACVVAPRRAASFDSAELLDTVEREQVQHDHHRRRRLRQADAATRSTPSPTAGTCRACS